MKNAFDSLVRCLAQGQGIGIVTAPAGLGKTILCQTLADELADPFATVLLPNANFTTRRSFLQTILCELGQPYVRMSEQELRLTLISTVRSLRPQKSGLALLIDEAHLLSDQLLEEARVLTNLLDNGEPLVRLLLSGQLPLEENLAASSLEALNQRIGCHVTLEPLTRQESADYIAFRLNQAGADPADVFSTEALRLICHASDGVPRCLNQLCDQSLMLGYLSEERPVGSNTVRTALDNLKQLPLHWNELPAARSSEESTAPQKPVENSTNAMPQELATSFAEDLSTEVFECEDPATECIEVGSDVGIEEVGIEKISSEEVGIEEVAIEVGSDDRHEAETDGIEVGSVLEVGDNHSASETFEVGAETEIAGNPVLMTAAEEDPVETIPTASIPVETIPVETIPTASDSFEEAVVDLYARLDAEYARPDGQIIVPPSSSLHEPMEPERPETHSVAVAETSPQEDSLLTAVLEIGREAEEALEAGSSASKPTADELDSTETNVTETDVAEEDVAAEPVDETNRQATRYEYDVVHPEPDDAPSAISETAENDQPLDRTSDHGATARRHQRDKLISELRRRYRKQA